MAPFITRLSSTGGGGIGGFGPGSKKRGGGGPVGFVPAITFPLAAATKQDLTPTLTATTYVPESAGLTHSASDWEIATNSSFTTIARSNIGTTSSKTSWALNYSKFGLTANTTYYARVRYKRSDNTYTDYSPTISFTTAAQVGSTYDSPVVAGSTNTTFTTHPTATFVKVMVYGRNGTPGNQGTNDTPHGGGGGYARAVFDVSTATTFAIYGVSGGNGGKFATNIPTQRNGGGQGLLFGPNTTLTSSRPSIWLAGGGGGGGGFNGGNQNATGGSGGGDTGGTGSNISAEGNGGQGGSQNAAGPGGNDGGSAGSGFNGGSAGGNGGGGGGGWYGGGSGGPAGWNCVGGGGGSGRYSMPAPVNPRNGGTTTGLPADPTWSGDLYDADHLTMTSGTVRAIYYG